MYLIFHGNVHTMHEYGYWTPTEEILEVYARAATGRYSAKKDNVEITYLSIQVYSTLHGSAVLLRAPRRVLQPGRADEFIVAASLQAEYLIDDLLHRVPPYPEPQPSNLAHTPSFTLW